MAYIETLKRNKKEYYYLTKNIRLSLNKWKKIRIKLGNKRPTKDEIKKKLKELRLEEYNIYKCSALNRI